MKSKNIFIILSILIVTSLFFGVNFSNASCSIGEISQMIKESEKCNTLSCFTSVLSRLETCKTETQQKKEEATKEISVLQQRVNELENSISQKNASIASLNAQIANLQYNINNLNREIIEIEKKMEQNRKRIHSAIKSFYEYDKENFVTIMLSSANISDFFGEVFYVENIEKELSSIIKELTKDKQSLKKKKEELAQNKVLIENNRSKLASEMSILTQEKAEQDRLLGIAQNNEADQAYILEKIKQEKTVVDSALRRLYEQSLRNSTNIVTGGSGGYPYYPSRCGVADEWKFLSCQCTSYAAWRWNSWGYYWYNTQPGRGSAKYWPEIANTLGYSTGAAPRQNAIVSWPNGAYGHVAIVEKILSGGWIRVSEYNFNPPGGESFSARDIGPGEYSNATFIYPE